MRTLLTLIAFLFSSLFAVADVNMAQLVGRWRYSDETFSSEHKFNADGTYTGSVGQKGKIVWENAGVWSLADNKIHYELTRSSLERIPVGTKDQDTLIEITRDWYIIETQKGIKRKYVRIP